MGWGGVFFPIRGVFERELQFTNICREFDRTKTSKSKFPGVCPGGLQGFDLRIKRIKFEKLSDPDIAFPETLHEKP
jgi:hypothetical protein